MRAWSVYDKATGMFTGTVYRGFPSIIEHNLKDGQGAIEGEYDHLSQRVELSTGFVVGFQPPAPDPDHVWNEQIKRWQPSPAAQERALRRAHALAQIAELEAKQPRAMREFALGHAGAPQRLAELDQAISTLRQQLSGES